MQSGCQSKRRADVYGMGDNGATMQVSGWETEQIRQWGEEEKINGPVPIAVGFRRVLRF